MQSLVCCSHAHLLAGIHIYFMHKAIKCKIQEGGKRQFSVGFAFTGRGFPGIQWHSRMVEGIHDLFLFGFYVVHVLS